MLIASKLILRKLMWFCPQTTCTGNLHDINIILWSADTILGLPQHLEVKTISAPNYWRSFKVCTNAHGASHIFILIQGRLGTESTTLGSRESIKAANVLKFNAINICTRKSQGNKYMD